MAWPIDYAELSKNSARCALPAIIFATRQKPALKVKYKRMRANGTHPKLAMIALMGKLLLFTDTLVTEDREWKESEPDQSGTSVDGFGLLIDMRHSGA